ncbi:MAG: universal stress protein [Chitinophagales bacterium]
MIKILVPTDFSSCANNAVDVALQIANQLKGEVHFYHRMDIPHIWNELSAEEKSVFTETQVNIKKAHQALNILERQSKETYPNVRITTTFSQGHLISTIGQYVDNFDIDLIVMGSHGASGINEWLIGSNTQKLVRLAHCPVLTIKNPIKKIDFSHIVFASNYDNNLKPPFRQLIDFARLFDAHIHLLTVDTPSFYQEPQYAVIKSMEEFKHLCEGKVKCSIHHFEDLNTLQGIKNFSKKFDIKIVAMATHGRKKLARAIMGSLTETVVNHLEIPVLSINLKAVLEVPEKRTPPFIHKTNERISNTIETILR